MNPDIDASELLPFAPSKEEAHAMWKPLWKGPYMVGNPQDFMKADEGSKIMLEMREQTLFLRRSATAEGEILVRFDDEVSVDDQIAEIVPY